MNRCLTVADLIRVLQTMKPWARIEGTWESQSKDVCDVIEVNRPEKVTHEDGTKAEYAAVVLLDVDGGWMRESMVKAGDPITPPIPEGIKVPIPPITFT